MGRSRAATIGFWVTAVVGWAIVAAGVRGILRDERTTRPGDLARWFGGLLAFHDLLLVPAVLVAGWVAGRVVPRRAVVPVRLGLAASALVVALAWPLVRGYGERASNPSLLPLPYGRNLAIALGLVWVAVAAALVVARRRGAR